MSPTAPLAGCVAYGCPELREPGHRTCADPEHRRLENEPNRRSQRRRRRIRTVYGTVAWAKLSERKLKLNPRCELKLKCDGAPATDVDHPNPIAWGGRELPPISELRSACHACHSAHTAETMLERDPRGRWTAKDAPETDRERYDRARSILRERTSSLDRARQTGRP